MKNYIKGGLVIERQVMTVRELTSRIQENLESEFSSFWVEGELSGWKRHTSGHIYFSLKDSSALIKAVFFSRYNHSLKADLEDGMKVLCRGKISVYAPRGDYQLYVEAIEVSGLGALQVAFEKLKKKLADEGLFDESRKKELPRYPRQIGIVTSRTGAAIRDIENVLGRRAAGFKAFLIPVAVQGDGSAEQVARAIEDFNQMPEIDLLIIGRGGGSPEDLWCFNEERVVRAIAVSEIPIISAVGHEVDWTLSDLAADLRAATPSAAAEIVTESCQDALRQLRDLTNGLRNSMSDLLARKREKWEQISNQYGLREPFAWVDMRSQKLDDLSRRLSQSMRYHIQNNRQTWQVLMGKLDALSPLAILKRGFSVTYGETGAPLTSVKGLVPGRRLRTRMSDGEIESIICEEGE